MNRITALILLLFTSSFAYAQPGYLDKTFADDGALILPSYYTHDICVLPDGKIVAAGEVRDTNSISLGLYVTKYTESGKPDESFGSSGTFLYPAAYTIRSAICQQPDGKLLVYGSILLKTGQPIYGFVLRILPGGTIDSSFGTNGLYIDGSPQTVSYIRSLQLQADGSLLAVGFVYPSSSPPNTSRLFLTKITADGKRDTQFGSGDMVMIGTSKDTGAVQDIVFTRSGHVVVAFADPKSKSPDLHLLKCDMDGVLDPTFADSGVLHMKLSDATDQLQSVVETKDGKLLCLSWLGTDISTRSVLFRLTTSGALDESFGNYGTVTPPITSDLTALIRCIIDSDGKLFTYGIYWTGEFEYTFCTARFHENGQIDSTYGVHGVGEGYPEGIVNERNAVVDSKGRYLINAHYSKNSVQGGLIYRVDNTPKSNVHTTEAASLSISLHPTPATDNCTVTYTLPTSGEYTMSLRDESGREVRTFANEYRTAGKHEEELDLRGLATGVYFVQIESNGTVQTAKLIKQ